MNRFLEQAEHLLDRDIALAKTALAQYSTVPLTPPQEVALISFIFNCGVRAFRISTLLKKLNRGDYIGTADELLRWVHAKGIKLEGLVNRRLAERKLFLMPLERHKIK